MCKVVQLHSRYAWFEHLLFMFFCVVVLFTCGPHFIVILGHCFHGKSALHLQYIEMRMASCKYNITWILTQMIQPDVGKNICLMSAKWHQSNVKMGECCWVANQMPIKPDIGLMLKTRRRYAHRFAVGSWSGRCQFDWQLVGIQLSV